MATAIQRRRGTSAQHANFTGLAGEITVDTTLNTIIVHDGVTEGGVRLAKYTEVVSASEGDITAVNTLLGSGLTGGTASGSANIAIDYENMQGNLVPSVDNVYSLGSEDRVWKDVYVGPGSLYVNGQKVLEDNSGTITVGASDGQNLALNTTGGGDIEFNSVGGGTIAFKSNVTIADGKSISLAGGGAVPFAGNINVDNNSINNLADPVASSDAATKNYVDTDATVVRVTGDQSIAGAKTFSDDVTVQGSLTVSGTVTTVNSETISLADNLIDLNSNFTTGSPSENAGFRILRGDEAAVQIRWNEAGDAWEFTNDGSTYKAMASTQDAREALSVSGDLGYDSATGVVSFTERTDAEVRSLVSASGDLAYNSTTGVISYTGRTDAQVRNLIGASGDLSYDSDTGTFSVTTYKSTDFDTDFASKSADNLTEGSSNLYFTQLRARQAISAGDGINYNATTGVIALSDTGYITEVLAGNGIVGGGASGTVILDIAGGDGITVNADSIEVDMSPFSTDDLVEGGNQYYTDARARNAINVNGDLTYNNTSGVISFSERTDAEVRGLLGAGGDLSYNSTTGVISFTERTDAEVRGLVSASGDLEYSSTTGEFSFTERTDTEVRSLVSAGTGLEYNGTTGEFSVDSTIATKTYADSAATTAVSAVIDAAPGTLDTLNELAAALGDDANFATTMTDSLAAKYDSADFNGDFDTRFASKDTGDLTEGDNLYYTQARFNTAFGAKSTSDLSEGSKLFYTNARANTAIDVRVTKSFVDNLGIDAITLNGLSPSYYLNATSINAGTLDNARLPDLVLSDFAGSAILTSVESFSDSDTTLMTAKAIADKIESYGYITTQSDDQTLSWDGDTGIISISSGNSVDLDGRYQLAGSYQAAGSYVTTTSAQALNASDALSFAGTTLSINKGDGTSESVNLSSLVDDTGTPAILSNGSTPSLNSGITAAEVRSLIGAQESGSYQASGSYVTTTSAQALRATDAIQVSNDTITIFKGDGTSEAVSISDATLSTEQVQDIVGAMFSGSGASSVSYNDTAGTITVSSTDTNTNTTYSAGTDLSLSGTQFNVSSATAATANTLAKRDSSGNLSANVFAGTATSARYADLAEKYATDAEYAAGTVVCFGGDAEVTACAHEAHHAVAGVISTDPAYMMNSEAEGQYVALTGRVPVKVVGPIAKGDLLVTAGVAGHAKADNNAQAGRIIGKAISSFDGEGEGVVEVLVNMM